MAEKGVLSEEAYIELIRLFVEDKRGVTAISRILGITPSTVCYHLNKFDLPGRGGKWREPHPNLKTRCSQCGGPDPVRGKCAPCRAAWLHAYNIRTKYGLTVEAYESLMAEYDWRCGICQRSDIGLNVDHDHACCPGKKTCGKCIRGVLCRRCNAAIGYLGEENIDSALRYLARRTTEVHSSGA